MGYLSRGPRLVEIVGQLLHLATSRTTEDPGTTGFCTLPGVINVRRAMDGFLNLRVVLLALIHRFRECAKQMTSRGNVVCHRVVRFTVWAIGGL